MMNGYHSQIALLGGVIDYAGTFPPAALPLDQALKKASQFRRQAHCPWLLGRITLNISDIKKITPEFLYENGSQGENIPFTALSSVTPDSDFLETLKKIEWDIRELQHWEERMGESSAHSRVIAYETRLPQECEITEILNRFRSLTQGVLPIYVECALEDEQWKTHLEKTTHSIRQWMDDQPKPLPRVGIKIRTGGKSIPTLEKMASVVELCARHHLRFKATQGLHEAFTHENQLGFINLFASFVLAQATGTQKFGTSTLLNCLQSPKFEFQKSSLKWNEFEISCSEIEKTRRVLAYSFGSCSLDEPDESLSKG